MSFAEVQEGSASVPPAVGAGLSPDPHNMLQLEVIAGNATGTMILVEDQLIIGRHAEGAGKLSDDSEISRQHARVSREASGDYAIEDLGSSNGTFVNGLKIPSPRLLELDDSIEVGATTLVVRSLRDSTPPAPPEPAPPAAGLAPTIFARAPQPSEESAPAAQRDTEVPPPMKVGMPSLRLELEVDFEAREARLALGGDDETVRYVFQDGCWRTPPTGA